MPTINPQWQIAQQQAIQQAEARKKIAEQSRLSMLMDWLRRQMGQGGENTPQSTTPAGSYLVNKETRQSQLDEAFR